MKRVHVLLLLYVMSIIFFISCNNEKKKPSNENIGEKVLAGDFCTQANFLIHPDEADAMIKRFKREFNDDFPVNKDLADSFWIDKCVINQFYQFLNKESGYDGVRFYSISSAGKSDLLIVPTFNNPNHDDAWGNLVPAIQGCNAIEFKNYNLDESMGKPLVDEFGRDFREERRNGEATTALNDSLSRGVWFGKCVIDSLSKYLNMASLELDGVKVHCGAYDKKVRARGQRKDIQSTFILVVSRPDGSGGHKSDWSVLINIFKNNKKALYADDGSAYNHGELCPDICSQ